MDYLQDIIRLKDIIQTCEFNCLEKAIIAILHIILNEVKRTLEDISAECEADKPSEAVLEPFGFLKRIINLDLPLSSANSILHPYLLSNQIVFWEDKPERFKVIGEG